MSLTVIAMPIGAPGEISKDALELIPTLDVLICESRKETSRLLRSHGVTARSYLELSEHSDKNDLQELIALCREQNAGLVSDCGTPGFCDPGADLVRECRKQNIAVRSLPGPSSLMAFFSVCGHRVDEFYFRGFLSANTEERRSQIQGLKKKYFCPVILMDTPYRMGKLLKDLSELWSESHLVLGGNFGMPDEFFSQGAPTDLVKRMGDQKAEFVLMVMSGSVPRDR